MSTVEHIITWLTGGGLVAVCGAIGLLFQQMNGVKELKKEVLELKDKLDAAYKTIDRLESLLIENNIQYKAMVNKQQVWNGATIVNAPKEK